MPQRDWVEWHRPYDDPDSALSARLKVVQHHVREALDRLPEGPARAVSICAGQGRDLIGVLSSHPRRTDVSARLVEAEPRNVEIAAAAGREAGLTGVDVVQGDASFTDAYVGAVPAQLVLACGIFGNISDGDIERTIACLPQLGSTGTTVIWTRHRRTPDATPAIRQLFESHGFDELAFEAPADSLFSVGVCRQTAPAVPLERGVRLFSFTGDGWRPA